MALKEVIEALLPVNCKYNFKVEKDGKCYSKDCMMNQDPVISARIKSDGCKVFKKIKGG